MSVDLKRVRDAHDDGNLSPASKKRLLSGSTAGGGQSPMSSSGGADADDNGVEDWMRVVHTHQKEAIYRQMLEYKREFKSADARLREFRAQQRRCEASENAMEACWSQVVSVMQDLVEQHGGTSSEATIEPTIETDQSLPELTEALQKRSSATQQLVLRLIDMARTSSPSSTGDLERRCASLHTESSNLRAVNKTLKSEIASLKNARDQAESSLARSQKQLDRVRMEHDKARSEWQAQPAASAGGRDTGRDGASTPGGLKPGGHANGPSSGHATPNGAPNGIKPEPGSSTDVKPLLEDASTLLSDSATLERLAETRLQELDRVCEEKAALNRELDRLRQLALNPSEEALRSAPFFGIYLRQLASQASELTSIRTRYAAAEGKLDELRNQNLAFRDAVVADGRAEAEALRVQVNKQNSDLARLRGQRDEMQAELAERRLREENALGSAKELDKLAKGQGERIGTLVQEVKRLKGKLGAEGSQGRRGYLSWLDEGVEGDYVAGLEDKVRDLETQLRATTSENPNGLPTADMQVELEKAKRDLETYQRIFGPAAEASDLSAMASKLEAADKARQELELRLEQSAASTNSLYSEVETLASLSDALQTQLSSKVFDMRDADGRLSRLATEKAKADNKYFQAMRTKEAIEAECRTAQRSVEKQARLLEKALEVEKSLQAQTAAQEKQVTGMKNEMQDLQGKWVKEQEGKREGEARLMAAQASLAEANSIMQQRVTEAAAERKLRIRHEEEADKAAAQVKRLKERQETLMAHSATQNLSTREVALTDERDKLMKLLRCSTCEQNFKGQMIVKCGHTFCKPCLDVRISTRQRKCPACGLGFSKEEVQTMFWQ